MRTGACLFTQSVIRTDGSYQNLAWSPDNQYIASGKGSSIIVWNVQTGERFCTCELAEGNDVRGLSWSPAGGLIASRSREKTVDIWEASTGNLLHSQRHSDDVKALAWSPDGIYLASASKDTGVQVREASTGNILYSYKEHGSSVYTLAWSPDGNYIASADTLHIRVWQIVVAPSLLFFRQKKEISKTVVYSNRDNIFATSVASLAWSPDSKYIASAYRGVNTIHVWDAHTATKVYSYQNMTESRSDLDTIHSICWSPDSNWILFASARKTQRWEHFTNQLLMTYQNKRLTQGIMSTWSPSGKYLATRGPDETLQIWEGDTGKLLHLHSNSGFLVHSFYETFCAWSPDSQHIIFSNDYSKILEIWDESSGKKLHEYEVDGSVTAVAWSPDGKYIASGSVDGQIQVWEEALTRKKRKCL